MKSTIDAMKQARDLFHGIYQHDDQHAFDARKGEEILNDAISREEAQTVGYALVPNDESMQAVIDESPDDEDKMFLQIEEWQRKSYNHHKRQIRGQQISRSDSPESHLVWATLRWTRENTPAQQVAVPQAWKLVPIEPTRGMIVDLMCTGLRHAEYVKGCSPTITNLAEGYAAMLAAAPQPPQGEMP